MGSRVSNEPLRREYLQALERGVQPTAICRAVGFVRPDPTSCCDVHRLRTVLGLVEARNGVGDPITLRTVSHERARAIRGAIWECSRWVCAVGCGERLSVPDGCCGFCENEGRAAA